MSTAEATATSSQLAIWNHPLRIVILTFVGVAPFLCIPLSHLLADPQQATGLFQYELPYYVANGNAAFDRGNGVFYPNPYDPSPDAPVIYVHWLPWIFGFCTTTLNLDPGTVIVTATIVAAMLFSFATFRIVRFLCPGPCLLPAYFLTMWGGGLLVVASLLIDGSPLTLDPGRGLWFLNWGRNCLLPTEAVYHSLVLTCWLAEWKSQKRSANLAMALLATTHPWSGLQLLLTMNAWRCLVLLRRKTSLAHDRWPFAHFAFSLTVLIAFLAYYKIWLPSFEAHAALQKTWELDWSVAWTTAIFAWGPIAVVAATCFLKQRQATKNIASNPHRDIKAFLMTAFAVAIGLALHDRIIKPVQPLHFTRGYVWMPLCLLAILSASLHLKPTGRNGWMPIVILGCLLMITDNFVFCAVHVNRQFKQKDGFFLSPAERQLLRQLDRSPDTHQKIGLTDSEDLNYLLPTYTRCRPWLGHHFNTPDYPNRRLQWEQWSTEQGFDFKAVDPIIDFVALRRTGTARDPEPAFWQLVDLPNAEFEVWKRR